MNGDRPRRRLVRHEPEIRNQLSIADAGRGVCHRVSLDATWEANLVQRRRGCNRDARRPDEGLQDSEWTTRLTEKHGSLPEGEPEAGPVPVQAAAIVGSGRYRNCLWLLCSTTHGV